MHYFIVHERWGAQGRAEKQSVLEAIRKGQWDFEPDDLSRNEFRETDALPGSAEKLDILADRVRRGLPLWHPSDRQDCEGMFEDELE